MALTDWSELALPMLKEAAGEPEITWITAVSGRYSVTAAQKFVEARLKAVTTGEALSLNIRDESSGKIIGAVNLNTFDWTHLTAHIGYWLVRSGRGHGFAKRAVRLMTEWGMTGLGLHEIDLRVEPGNEASMRVAEACGYVRVGEVVDTPYGATEPLHLIRFVLQSGSGE